MPKFCKNREKCKIDSHYLSIEITKWREFHFMDSKESILSEYKTGRCYLQYFGCYWHPKMRFWLKTGWFLGFLSYEVFIVWSWLNPHMNQRCRLSIQNFHILPHILQILAKSAIFAKTGWFLGFSYLSKYLSYEVG